MRYGHGKCVYQFPGLYWFSFAQGSRIIQKIDKQNHTLSLRHINFEHPFYTPIFYKKTKFLHENKTLFAFCTLLLKLRRWLRLLNVTSSYERNMGVRVKLLKFRRLFAMTILQTDRKNVWKSSWYAIYIRVYDVG